MPAMVLADAIVSEPYRVEAAATVAYARATNDENPAHLAGRLAPPLFAVVPALKTLVQAKRLATDAFTLHGEHDIHFMRPIVPGMTLVTEARLMGIRHTPAGTTLTVHGVSRAEGRPVNEQYLVLVAQRRQLLSEAGDVAPEHRTPPGVTAAPPLARHAYELDPDQTRRYAEASGDRDPYTFDPEEARKRGLPGPIVHGLCAMAFAARAVVAACCGGDSTRLARLAVRFSRLLLMRPGQRLATSIWSAGRRDGLELFALEAADAEGSLVLRHGWAEVTGRGKEG
jgi:acyl dehydratase